MRAVNPVTGDGYAHLDFTVRSGKTGAFGDNYTTEYTGTLNENGEAIFNLKLSSGKSYRLFMQKPDNTCYQNITDYVMKKDDLNMLAQFEYAPCAYLKFRYQNISCFDENDRVEVYRYTNLPNYAGFLINAVYEGCADYTMPNFVEVPMGWWFFEWTVTKNGITENFTDSVYLSSGQQKYYEFQY